MERSYGNPMEKSEEKIRYLLMTSMKEGFIPQLILEADMHSTQKRVHYYGLKNMTGGPIITTIVVHCFIKVKCIIPIQGQLLKQILLLVKH